MLRIAAVEHHVDVLGPGQRLCLWLQGCSHHCPGCESAYTWDPNGGHEISATALALMIGIDENEWTISGGEPLDQPELVELINAATELNGSKPGIILYTGYLLEEAPTDARELIALCDVVIDGRYDRTKDPGVGLKGSTNQRVYCFTDRYKDYLEQFETAPRKHLVRRHSSYDFVVGLGSTFDMNELINKDHNKEEKT